MLVQAEIIPPASPSTKVRVIYQRLFDGEWMKVEEVILDDFDPMVAGHLIKDQVRMIVEVLED